MKNKLYVVYGGYVRSKNDKQVHHIGPRKVAELYRVNPDHCIFVSESTETDFNNMPYGIRDNGLIKLSPQNNGNYTLPKSKI